MTDPAVVPEPTDEQIDADLALDGFDPTDRYPEHGHDALRTAWRSGFETALIRAGRDSRDGILVPVELLSRLMEFTHDHADCSENVAAFHTYDIARRLLTGHTTDKES